MKKLIKMLAAAAMVACGLMMSGCDLDDDTKEILGPNNVWCEFRSTDSDTTYTDSNNTSTKMTYYFKYVESTDTLSIAVFPAEGSAMATTFNTAVSGAASSLTGYYQKEYVGLTSTSGTTDDDDSLSFDMTQTKWEIFYTAKLKKSSLPSNSVAIDLTKASESIQAVKESFSLKTILQVVINYL